MVLKERSQASEYLSVSNGNKIKTTKQFKTLKNVSIVYHDFKFSYFITYMFFS